MAPASAVFRRALRRLRARARSRSRCCSASSRPRRRRLPQRLSDARRPARASPARSATTRALRLLLRRAARPADAWRLGCRGGSAGPVGVRGAVGAVRRRARAARRRRSRSPGARPRRRRRPRRRVPGGDRRDRRRRGRAVARAVRRPRCRATSTPAARPTWRSRCSRPRWCSPASARWRASSRRRAAVALGIGGGVLVARARCCAWWPTPPRRSAGCAGRRRSAGPRSCGRSSAPGRSCSCCPRWPPCCCSPRHGGSRERRDIGAGLLPARDSAPPRTFGALVAGRAGACAASAARWSRWLAGTGAFAAAPRRAGGQRVRRDLGQPRRAVPEARRRRWSRPKGFLGLEFLFLVLAISLFVCVQIAAARRGGGRAAARDPVRAAGRPAPLARRAPRRRGAAARPRSRSSPALLAWAGAAASGAGVSLGALWGRGRTACPRRCSSSASARCSTRSCRARARRSRSASSA